MVQRRTEIQVRPEQFRRCYAMQENQKLEILDVAAKAV